MKIETLEEANSLKGDIENIETVLKEKKQRHWISVVAPCKEMRYSLRFQRELAEWLTQKLEEYKESLMNCERRW